MKVFPNAKINLGLFITSKREDGFHNLESLFYPIPLCDELEIEEGSTEFELQLENSSETIPLTSNIVYKAWKLLHDTYSIPPVRVRLVKHIPSGAGMGGGSSDGTFMLKALNELFQLNLTIEKLEELAAELGSDCPFFVRNTPAVVKGRGEFIHPVDFSLAGSTLIVVNPGIHISTKEAFSGITPSPCNLNWELLVQDFYSHSNELRNDFEGSAFLNHPVLLNVKSDLLQQGASYACMSGTGSTMFGLFRDEIPLDYKNVHFFRRIKL